MIDAKELDEEAVLDAAAEEAKCVDLGDEHIIANMQYDIDELRKVVKKLVAANRKSLFVKTV